MKRCMPVCSHIIFLLTAFHLILSGGHGRKVINQTVVTVNSDVILESDIKNFRKKIKSKSFQELFGGIDPKALNSRQAVIQLLVEEKIINQQVKKLDLEASDKEVSGQIKAIVKRNQITEAQLGMRLRQLGTTMAEYREGIKRQIERGNLIEREIKPNLKVSEQQLNHYYSKKQGKKGLSYEIAHILVEIEGSESKARQRIEKIYQSLKKKPGDFKKLAKEVSDDESTAANGGNLGVFSSDSLSNEFRSAVTSTRAGRVSRPVKTPAGFHVIKVLSVKKGGAVNLDPRTKEQLRKELLAIEIEKNFRLWLERKKADAYIRFKKKSKKNGR